jgi:histidine triad (HIT) family protein
MTAKDKGKDKDPVLDALKQTSKGLLWPSESEAPLEPFAWKEGGALTQERLLELAGAEEGTAVEETDLASLLRTIPPEDKAKFDKLNKVLQEQLSGVKVYKVGDETEREVYIVGKAKDGRWVGLKTSVVET